MNTAEFAKIAVLNSEEFSALESILGNNAVMQMAQVIAEKCFQQECCSGENFFPESPALSQAWFAAAYLSIDYSHRKFQLLGYPDDVWHDTISDMAIWLRHEKRNNGIIGLGTVARIWTAVLFNAKVIRRGRLECNTNYLYKERDLRDPENNLLLVYGDPVINIHIPEDGALDLALCSKSLKAMAEFFAEFHKDYNWKAVICQSWLLDCQLRSMLPASSNIIKFQNTGIHYPVDEAADTVFRVFGNQDPFAIKNPTSLQRKAADFLRQGGVFREEGLCIPRHKLEEVDFNLAALNGN